MHDRKTALKAACVSIRQKMKFTESFASPHLYSFGKTFILNSIWASSLLKKGAKIHPFDNSILPTLFESMGSIFSNAHSATSTLPFSATLHLVANIITTWFVGMEYTLFLKGMTAFLYTPNVLGGAPLLSLEEMLARTSTALVRRSF